MDFHFLKYKLDPPASLQASVFGFFDIVSPTATTVSIFEPQDNLREGKQRDHYFRLIISSSPAWIVLEATLTPYYTIFTKSVLIKSSKVIPERLPIFFIFSPSSLPAKIYSATSNLFASHPVENNLILCYVVSCYLAWFRWESVLGI